MLVGTQLQRRCGFEFALGERALAVRRRGELDAHCVGRSFGSSKLTYEEDVWMIDGVMRMVCNCLVGVGLRSRVVFCRLTLGGGVDAAFYYARRNVGLLHHFHRSQMDGVLFKKD